MKSRKKPDNTIPRHPRMVSRGDGLKIISTGRRKQILGDTYIRLLGARWRKIILVMTSLYIVINIVFALAYLSIRDGIEHAHSGSFADAFFFSVQTLATIGYGGMIPHGIIANLLVTLESMFGFAFYGVVTGLVFSKFSRPTARILFSDKAVINTHNGKPHFMLRMANERDNRIVDASAKLTLMRDEKTQEGVSMRRFYDLPLVRREIPILRLTWTVMHEITEHSPLFNITPEKLSAMEAEIIVSVSGIDETLSQTVHARHSYIMDEIICGSAFEDILIRRENYVLEVRYDRFHHLKLVEKELP
jgi:inward rectifier potassium channel